MGRPHELHPCVAAWLGGPANWGALMAAADAGPPEIIQRNQDAKDDALFVSIITLVEGVAGLLLAVIALVVGESQRAAVARTRFPPTS